MKIIRPSAVKDTGYTTDSDAALTLTNITEADYAAYAAGTTYAAGARVIVIAPNTHKIYESLQAGNIGHTPASSPTWWLDIGATNRWKMFDYSVTSQSSRADSIDVTLQAGGRVNALALPNIAGASVQVIMTDAIDGVVYDKTFSLISTAGIGDWYAYYFEPIVRLGDLLVTDMPPYYQPTVRVIISAPGETVLCGALVLGLLLDFSGAQGGTQYGATVGIQDYSVKVQDDFGNYTILQRAFRKLATFTVFIPASKVDQLQALLAEYRATPIVYIGSDLYSATVIYGYYKSFQTAIQYAKESVCNINLEGLT